MNAKENRLTEATRGAAWLALLTVLACHGAPLATLEYEIRGAQLLVTPAALSVPKGIAGSVLVELSGGGDSLPDGAFVEATLRGPSFPARRVIGQVNQPLLLPPLPLAGDYQLDNIRLVRQEGTSTVTLQEANPSSVPIRVFDEVLVSRVTSRPLTLDEIREKGIAIDDQNFRAVEFEIGFVLDGKTIPVRFPVVAPAFQGNTEIIPAAELERRLAEAEAINNQIDLGSVLPPELETARLNIEIKGINFQVTEEFDQDLALSVPAIPALMVIPGNIGFLNQFFSVQIFTENGAPAGSGLSVINVQAALKLPPGPDTLVSTNYSQPGDDPLRFARVGADKIIQPLQPVVRPGADGRTGTSDDIPRLQPGESGSGEFLVEGLQEGLHVMDLELTADLEGLAAGVVRIKGKAAGSVLVRNPRFSLAFSHPRTVRTGEPYDLYVTVLNTSSTVANLVQVVMAAASISGGVLETDETVVLGTILPGQTATARFRIRSQRTGAISFSNLTTSDDSLTGRFRLRGGFDERGVALSPDTIGMPGYVTNLPPALIDAANRVLGQALSVATAGQLPPNVKSIGKSVITRRVLELAEAGQRVQYGDALPRVLADILLDWQGGRSFNAGFDQIVRETDAGREWREAVALHQDQADGLNGVTRLIERLPDLAGRGEAWAIFTLDSEAGTVRFGDGVNGRIPPENTNNLAARYDHTNAPSGLWFVTRPGTNLVFEWQPDAAVASAQLALTVLETNGTARELRWNVGSLPGGACVRYEAGDPSGRLLIDNNCDGANDATLAASVSVVNELPPTLVSARQDPSVLAGRPSKICSTVTGFPLNYATVVAVLFSKPMSQDQVNVPAAFTLENGNVAGSVQIQPGGRVALLNLRRPVGALRPRTMTVAGVTDPRGHALVSSSVLVQSDLRGGVALRGRVARADGSPAAGVPVTLTYYDRISTGLGCDDFIVRPTQVFTDESGYFDLDFVVSGIPYSISATDTLGLSPEAIALILESTRADEFQRSKLLELASSASAQNTLLAEFAVGTVTEVVARAEGLDRALLRDFIDQGSAREGTSVPVALRFRGRGGVSGRVVAADGVTPVPRVAVNLFPDPASRELGRGLFSDGDGRFAFFGVPLGIFSLEANSGFGLSRTVAGAIDQPGQLAEVLVVLSSAEVLRTDLTGRVTENDNATPHAGATVFVGKIDAQEKFCCVVSAPTADADGYWRASGIPADTYVLMAVSQDGRRKGERRGITAPAGVTNFASIALQGFGVVIGRVETASGIPVVNAIVAGGEQLVRTTNNGTFRLTGVPTGSRTINAGVERSRPGEPAKSTPAFSFPRLGSAGVNVIPGVENFVVVRLEAKGSLIGRVVDETGTNAVTGINVALPEAGGFQWVPVNNRGEFAFEGIALTKYIVSAPAPPVFNTDVSGILDTLGDSESSAGELQAAIGEAFAIFTGAADPLLNGEGAAFNPGRWGYSEVDLTADGEIRNVTVQFLRASTIAGTVINGQGVPIGARVRLTGVGPAPNGSPATLIRGEMNSDPALGTFEFERQALIGSYGLQAASPFFPVVLAVSGFTSEPDDTNVVLQFPATRDINGRLTGFAFNPDGSPADAGVKIRIRSFDLEILTRTNGFFDTQIALPALSLEGVPGKGYFVEAEDSANATVGAAGVTLMPGVTNQVSIRLLGRGALRVTVLLNDGTPAAGASIGYDQGDYPQERVPLGGGPNADVNGQTVLPNLFEGSYSVSARIVSGPTTLLGRGAVSLQGGMTNEVTIRLGPTGTIEGHFVKRDLVTPNGFAQIAVGSIGYATTDSNGFFRVAGLPLGAHRLISHDPVTGVGASLVTTLSFNGQTNVVRLIEQSRGEIRGAVIASDGISFAPGVNVTLQVSDGITPSRMVTTGPDGRFSFPGAAAGRFELNAQHPVTELAGANSAVLPENSAFFEINVPLQPLAAVTVVVRRPDGVTPATNASVRLGEFAADTDNAGRVTFGDLRLGEYTATATSRTLSETRSVGRTNVALTTPGQAPDLFIRLAGVGRVSGQVLLSNGSTPAVGAVVTLSHLGDFNRYSLNTTTDASGQFGISNVAVGPYEVSARSGTLGTRVAGTIAIDGEADTLSLTVEPSATVAGRLVRADGVTPVAGEDVVLTLPGRGLPGSLFRTEANGLFEFASIPLGLFRLQSTALGFNGIALRDGTLTLNGETNDVGNLVMDEDDPHVVSASPPDTAVGVPITAPVELVFNEALRSNTVDVTGVYLQGPSNTVAASVQLLNDTSGVPRRVRLTPTAPLRSLSTYRVVVVDDIRQDVLGTIIGRGPQDLVGRPLVAPFLSTFTTADNDPPLLVSVFPASGQIQIDPRAVMRLSFNEPVRESNFVFTLTGPGGLVPGVASVGLNGLVLAFAPTAALQPNRTYTLAVSNVFDLAGNRATNEPFTATFTTLDTLGPTFALLRLADGVSPVAGASVPIEAVLTTNEPGVSVRFTQDLQPAGSDNTAPFRVTAVLPAVGSTTFRAIATDRFGNDGPFAELVVNVVSNQPPVIVLARGTPATGPLTNGQPFTLVVSASDDLGVTNVNLRGLGAIPFSTNFSSGAAQTLPFLVPTNAPSDGLFQFRAQATDGLGAKSPEAVIDLQVIDSLPPLLAIASPADNAVVNPAQPLNLVVISSDNSTNHSLEVVLGGGVTSSQTRSVVSSANVPVTNTFVFSLAGAPSDGAILTATVRASDRVTNTAVVSRTFRLPDNRPPRLATVNPTNDAPRQSLWLGNVVHDFDEALDPASVTTNRLAVTNSAGVATAFTVSLANGNRQMRVSLARPLLPGVTYTNLLLPGLADVSGNSWQGAGGATVPAQGIAFTFTTARVFATVPSNGTRVIAGQSVNLRANYEAGLGASQFQFQFEASAPVQVSAGSTSAVATVIIPTNTASGPRTVQISASPDATFAEAFAFTPVVLEVRPLAGDEDGDGLPNSFELANGLDPFVNDAGLDPDSDNLANLAEFQRGTNPRDADSDDDGLNDGAEVALGCANPLEADTDGDGLNDGIDPNPCSVASGLTFTTPAVFNLVEGATTNLVVQVASTNAAIVLLDYTTNLPPAFVSVKLRSQSNTPTNGVATLELEFNPLHDAAGEHTLELRAASTANESGTVSIRLVVGDNPALSVTRWKDPVDGNWNDASRWTDGLPAPGKVAVIDVVGSYVVSLNSPVTAAGVVLDHTNAVLRPTTDPILDAPFELRGGMFEINTSRTLTLNRPLVNLGVMKWISANNVFNVQGSGRVENEGMWEVMADPGCPTCGAESVVRVPVNVRVGGRFLVSTNGKVNFPAPSSLTVAGELEVQGGARLRLDSSAPGRDLTLAAGSVLSGTGTIQVEGSCRLVVPGDLDTTVGINLSGSAGLIVPGTYTVRSSRSMSGAVNSAVVVVASNAVFSVSSTSFAGKVEVQEGGLLRGTGGTIAFGTNVLVQSGGRLDLEPGSPVIDLNGVLTNRGVMKWISANNVFNVQGSGRVENEGMWEVMADPGCPTCGAESVVRVPVNVRVGGRFLVSTNGKVNFPAPSSLTVAGELEVQGGARLRLDSSAPGRDLTLAAGSVLSGTGTIQVEGSCRLVVPGDLDTTVGINTVNPAQLVVPGTYFVRTSRSVGGLVSAVAAVIFSNATVTASSATFTGPVTVQSGGVLAASGLTVPGLMTVENGATLRLTGGTASFGTNVLVQSGGRLDLEPGSPVIDLNGVLTNRGVMKWISANNVFNVQGSGRVENEGMWEVMADPGCPTCGAESVVRVPVNVRVGGRFLVSTNGKVNFPAPSSLTVAGELEVQGGARLRLDSSAPGRDLTLAAGSVLSGTGTIQVEGSCRLVVPGDLDTTVGINLSGSAGLIVPGTYTVRSSRSMSGAVNSAVVVVASNAVFSVSSTSFAGKVEVQEGGLLRGTGGTIAFGTNVLVQSGGRLDLEPGSPVIDLNGVLTNRGVMKWISANNVFNVQGSGRVENEGMWEVMADPGCPTCGAESVVRVPVNVRVGGRFLVSTNGKVNFPAPSSLTVAGELEVQGGARLRLDSSAPGRDLTLAAGSVLSGTGTIQVEGSCRLVVPGDLDTTVGINTVNPAQLVVPGTYFVRTSRSVGGLVSAVAAVIFSNATVTASSATFTGPVTVQSGGVLAASGLTVPGLMTVENGATLRLTGGTASFGTNVLVQSGGRLDLEPGSPVIDLNGVLTNRGVMKWISANNVFNVQGSGRVENEGMWEVMADPGCPTCGAESVVRVPVNVRVGGRFLVSTNGKVNFPAPSSLTVAGELEVQSGARLRLDSSAPGRDLTLAAGSVLSGTGTIRLEGPNRVLLAGDVTFGSGLLEMTGSSSIAGSFTLTIVPGSELRFDHSSTIPGSVILDGVLHNSSATATLTINGTLTLNASGTLNNPGTLRASVFVNNGGTIIGNPPVALAPPALRIDDVQVSGATAEARASGATGATREVRLFWTAPAGARFIVERSTDLSGWTKVGAAITESVPGTYVAVVTSTGPSGSFYRLRSE